MATFINTDVQEVPNYSTIRDLRDQQAIPPERDIIELSPQGGIVRKPESDQTIPEGIYIDVPRYIRGTQNVARMPAEMELLAKTLPDQVNIVADHPNYTYVLFENYPLGRAYEPAESHVLIFLPDNYPSTPPGLTATNGIYVTGGLTWRGRPLECLRDQYHWQCGHNHKHDLKARGWAWWCFAELKNWNHQRDTMFTVMALLTKTLQNPERQRYG